MNKTLVVNSLKSGEQESYCSLSFCKWWGSVDNFQKKVSEKKALERKMTEKFNAFSGATFKQGKVNTHTLFMENKYVKENVHGVYRFKQEDKSSIYHLYFGPIIKVKKEALGCSIGGCKPSFSGCKPGGCNSIGCKSKGGDNIQRLNFLNDDKNDEDVKGLNKYFGLRKFFKKEMDYKWDQGEIISVAEYVKNNIDQINDQFQKDLSEITANGLGIHSLIDTPSYESLFTQAVLFSNDSNVKKAKVSMIESNLKSYLSRFELWYFAKAKGLVDYLFEIPVIGWLLRLLFGKKKVNLIGSSRISEENIKKLEDLYSAEFDEQAAVLDDIENKTTARKIIAKIPVTIAVEDSITDDWFRKLFGWAMDKTYTFHTFIVGCDDE